MTYLHPGKLPSNLLRGLLATFDSDDSVIVGPGIGRDAAAVRVGDRVLVFKSDPITFATENIGWYLVNINANDIACMGAEPRWLLVTALLPESHTTPELVESIFADLQRATDRVGCTLIGGHTEITEGLDRPILVGSMIGVAPEEGVIDPSTAEPGDVILLAGGIAIEGTALLAIEFAARLTSVIDEETLARSRDYLNDPGISVVTYARSLREELGSSLRALHDPTEGGLATGISEIAEATGRGVLIDGDQIMVYPETRALCEALDVDPLGLIASGALLAVVPAGDLDRAMNALRSQGVPAACIGHLTPEPSERTLIAGAERFSLPVFEVDEIARLFSTNQGSVRSGC